MASHYAKIFSVATSHHTDPQLNVRPPAELLEQAKEVLSSRGHEIRAFVVACMRALNADPDAFLALLGEHWPEPKPRGRPRRQATAPDQPADVPEAESPSNLGQSADDRH